ncbi:putative tail protein [Xylophilus phage Lumi]|nr:putative tail protein [Xylophilus phage Lumi]
MAGNSKDYSVKVSWTESGGEILQRKLDDLSKKTKAIPENLKGTGEQVNKLIAGMKAVNDAIAKGDVTTEQFKDGMEDVAATLKTISMLSKGLDIISKSEIDDVNQLTLALQKAARAQAELEFAARVKSGNTGSNRSLSELQADLKKTQAYQRAAAAPGRQGDFDPLGVSTDTLGKYNRLLEEQIALKRKSAEVERSEVQLINEKGRIVTNQAKAQRDAALAERVKSGSVAGDQTIKDIDRDLKRVKTLQDAVKAPGQTGEFNWLGATAKDIDAFQDKLLKVRATRVEDERLRKQSVDAQRKDDAEATREIARQSRLKADAAYRASPEYQQQQQDLSKKASERNVNSRLSLGLGEGAASLAVVQASLMANSAILNGFISSIQNAIGFAVQFQASLANVQAVTGSTNVEMIGLTETITKVSTQTKFSTLEVAEAALVLGQAGLSVKQISESLPAVVTLATAAGTTIAQAVDLVTSVVGVFDKTAADVGDVANKITQAANGSKLSVGQLALGFQYAGNTAAQMGISFEEVTAAMAAMSNAGIKSGSTMGTGLRQFLVEVQKPSEDFLKILSQLGLSISDLDFRTQGFVGVMKNLRESGFVASDAIKSFDVRGAAAFNALLARPDDFKNQYDALEGSTAAMKANEIQMNTLAAQGSRLANALGNTASAGFEPTTKSATAFTKILGDVVSMISECTLVLNVLGTLLVGAAAAAITFYAGQWIAGMGTVLPMLRNLLVGTQAAATGMMALNASSLTLAGASGLLGVAVVAGVAAYTAYNAIVETASEKIDKQEAIVNKLRGAYEEKAQAITSVSNKIDLLNARQEALRADSTLLNQQIEEARRLTDNWSTSVISTNSTLDQLIDKLKAVREELRKNAQLDLSAIADASINKATAVLNAQKEKVQDFSKDKILDILDPKNARSILGAKGMTSEEREILMRAGAQLRAGGPDLAKSDDVSKVVGILARNQEGIAGTGKWASFGQGNGTLGNLLAQRVGELTGTFADTRAAKAKAESDVQAAGTNRYKDQVRASLRSQGIDPDILEGRPVDLRGDAERQLKASGIAKPTEEQIQTATRPLLVEFRKKVTEAGDAAEKVASEFDGIAGPDLKQYFKNKATTAARSAGETFRAAGQATTDSINIQSDKSSDNDELRKLKARMSQGNGRAGDLARMEELVRSTRAVKFSAETASVEPGERFDAMQAKENRGLNEELETLREAAANKARQAWIQSTKISADGFKALADAEISKAKSDRAKVSGSMDMDQIENALDSGIAHLVAAKNLELKALNQTIDSKTSQQNTDEMKASFANQKEAIEEKSKAAIAQYISTYKGVIEGSLRLAFNITDAIKKADVQIRRAIEASQERLYQGDAGLRDNDRENARNTGAVSGLRRSSVDKYLNDRAREPLALDSVNRQIEEAKSIRQTQIEQRDRLQALAADARSQFNAADASRKSILGDRSEDSALSDPEYQKANILAGKLGPAATAADQEVEKLNKTLRDTRKELDSLQLQKIGLTPSEELGMSWDGVTNSMLKSYQAWGMMIERQDTYKGIEEGTLGVLQSVPNELANAASAIVTHTSTIGEAFRSMSITIIKAMINVLAQALALNAVKGILGMFGGAGNLFGASAGASSLGSAAAVNGSAGGGAILSFGGNMVAAKGGQLTPTGFVRMADGGTVVGGTPNKDSVPTLLMPDEFVVQKSAVNAVGTDFLHSLNSQTASTITSSAAKTRGAAASTTQSGPQGDFNVYLVTEGSQPTMGPNDVIVLVTQNLVNKGPIYQQTRAAVGV